MPIEDDPETELRSRIKTRLSDPVGEPSGDTAAPAAPAPIAPAEFTPEPVQAIPPNQPMPGGAPKPPMGGPPGMVWNGVTWVGGGNAIPGTPAPLSSPPLPLEAQPIAVQPDPIGGYGPIQPLPMDVPQKKPPFAPGIVGGYTGPPAMTNDATRAAFLMAPGEREPMAPPLEAMPPADQLRSQLRNRFLQRRARRRMPPS